MHSKAAVKTNTTLTGHQNVGKDHPLEGYAQLFILFFSGFEIIMVHPRFYWGNVGNNLTPALFELPVSHNYHHGGWTAGQPFFDGTNAPLSASRTYDIFNQNGWGEKPAFSFSLATCDHRYHLPRFGFLYQACTA